MRLVPRPGRSPDPRFAWVLRTATLALALAAGLTTSASAQLVVDGILFWNNGASGTLAGQFTGAPTGAALTLCNTTYGSAGYSAAELGTLTFPNNRYADPRLPNAAFPTTTPNFQPQLGSPAWLQAVRVPSDGFFEQTCWMGAIGPDANDDWTKGWTYFDSLGAGRQDLHLAGMPDPRPLAVHPNVIANTDQFWGADSNHLVRGQFRVIGGATLRIMPGTVVFEERATLGTIRIDRGSRIIADGKPDSVIIITSDDAPGTQTVGAGGGLVINGYARVNNANTCAGDSAAAEGGAVGFYGGDDDDDNSGVVRYVRVEYAGKEVTPNNELNSFTNNAVGRNTTFEFLQAHRGADDGFECFGGTTQVKHLVCSDGRDDGFDWQQGYRGKAQFVIVRGVSDLAPSGTQFGDKAIEGDNNDVSPFTQTVCAGRSNPTVANMTFVGDRTRFGAAFPGSTGGIHLRRATAGSVLNAIVTNFKTQGVLIDTDATWNAHCAQVVASPGLHCSDATTGVRVGGGSIVISSAPNPFHKRVDFRFSLPQAGRVTVQVFSADGRLVDTVANGDMPAGQHSVRWDTPAPSGVYFYKVFANGTSSTGKVVRVD
jgi:hypothetical protein